jgi:hypothetical protein
MNDEKEAQLAWDLWNLIEKLNNLLWDRYEYQFIEYHMKEEEQKYWDTLADNQEDGDNDPIWGSAP